VAQIGAGHYPGRLARKAAAEDAQAGQNGLLVGVHHCPGSFKDGAYAALPRRQVGQIGGQKIKAVLNFAGDFLRCQQV
jgi:hypothetical protein